MNHDFHRHLGPNPPPVEEEKAAPAPDWFIKRVLKAARMPISGRIPELRGHVANVTPGIVTVLTDSAIWPLVKCCGPNFVAGLKIGDKVKCWFRVNPALTFAGWTCRKVE